MEFMDEIIFVGLDIPKTVKKMLDQEDENICKGMTSNEKEAYNFGVKTALSALIGLMSDKEDNEVYVNIPDKYTWEEFYYDDLKRIILK